MSGRVSPSSVSRFGALSVPAHVGLRAQPGTHTHRHTHCAHVGQVWLPVWDSVCVPAAAPGAARSYLTPMVCAVSRCASHGRGVSWTRWVKRRSFNVILHQLGSFQRGCVVCVPLVVLEGGKAFVPGGKDKFQGVLVSSRTALRSLPHSSGVLLYYFVLLVFKRFFSVRVRFILCSRELCKLRQRLSPDVSVLAEPIVNAPSRISSMEPCLRLSQASVPVDWLFRGYSCQRGLRALLLAFAHLTVAVKGILCLVVVGFYFF